MTVEELSERLLESEFWEWVEFFKMQNEEMKKAQESSKRGR